VFPIRWPEPFGLVMIEAMACGTPVIAYPCGSVPEVIEDGVTGRIVGSVDEALSAISDVGRLDRMQIRKRFERKFSSDRMAEDYLDLYDRLISARARPDAAAEVQRRLTSDTGPVPRRLGHTLSLPRDRPSPVAYKD